MKLTVVIPCRDDPRLVECVRSVDANAEILIVLNGSPAGFRGELERELGDRARFEVLARPNLPRALEHGILAASWDRVLLMDSDCVFQPGSLAAIEKAFDRGAPGDEVYRGRIVFERGTGRSTALVARSRTQRWSGPLTVYKPPLAFDRRLSERLGGYFFDPRLIWREDAALSHRVHQAGIQIVSVEGCVIHHGPLSLTADLRSNFRYGVGAAIARHLGIQLSPPERSVVTALLRDGPDAALYMMVANHVLTAGYAYAGARLRLSRGKWLTQVA